MAFSTSLWLALLACRAGRPPAPEPRDCSASIQTERVVVRSDQADDLTGRYVDAFDTDADGCDDVIVSEPRPVFAAHEGQDGAHLLRAPFNGGPLADVAFATWVGGGVYWAEPAVGLPGAVAVTGLAAGEPSGGEYSVHILGLPQVALPEPISSADRLGTLEETGGGIGLGAWLGACTGSAGGDALCASAIQAEPETFESAGMVLTYPLPIEQVQPVLEAETRLVGDEADGAQFFSGRHDLDGDGRPDMVVGAYQSAGTGRVAVVAPTPIGAHRVWDVATGTIAGSVDGGRLGLSVETGDLDGDGHVDVLAGAPIAGGGTAYAVSGPVVGEVTANSADRSVVGDQDGDWAGYDQAVADVDADGAMDWIVGVPGNFYFATRPGRVLVFLAPAPGEYTSADADHVLTSGSEEADAFGISLATGLFDGDQLADIVVGAPRDPTVGKDAGAATLIFGAGL